MPLPKAIQNAPELELGLDFFYVAFLELSSCRQIGMEEGPIPWTAIDTYCFRFELESEMRDDMFHFVRSLDNEYLRFRKSKSGKG